MNFEKLYIPAEAVERFTVLYQILSHAAKWYPNRTAYCQPKGKDTESTVTFAGLKQNVNALRAALVARGMADRHSAIFGESSYQWVTAYLALVTGCGVAVPLDKENPVETAAKQICHADVQTVFCSARSLKKLQKILPEMNLAGSLVLLLIAVVIMCLASAFYFTADLGVSTYDAVSLIIS